MIYSTDENNENNEKKESEGGGKTLAQENPIRNLRIAFWKKESGNFVTAKTSLTSEQVEFLHQLKPGDRLILFPNNMRKDTDPSFVLKKLTTDGSQIVPS